ncbi:MAG TPA: LysR family transcriptional regulator [Spongiibacteraceae bacterium]|nr:LysR family transcriptional regulator [Spongiibacteraceae bacterium]
MIKISMRQLEIFCAIVGAGSTTAAAAHIGLSQSAVSAALNELESVLATKLFDRAGKRLLLNDAGKALLPQARRALDDATQIEAHFAQRSDDTPATLTIGASSTIGNYVLPALLAAFHEKAVNTRVNIRIGNSTTIAGMVANFEVDMGIIEGPCHETSLDATPWLEDELVIVGGHGHPLTRQKQTSIADLQNADWLLREPGSGTREEVACALLPHLHAFRSTVAIGSSEGIKRSVAAGLGISCLSNWVIDDLLKTGSLHVLKTPLPPLKRRFHLLCHRDKFITKNLAALLEHLHAAQLQKT